MTDNMNVAAFGDELLEQFLDDAAEEGVSQGSRVNYGKFNLVGLKLTKWVNGTPTEIDMDEYRKLGKRDRSAELVMEVDIQEFNPELDFTYNRKVRLNSNDWFRHWYRSVVEYFGLEEQLGDQELSKRERDAELGKAVMRETRNLSGKYVVIEDEVQENSKDKTDDEKKYYTPALVEVFSSRSACVSAYNDRFGKNVELGDDVPENAVVPDGFNSYSEFANSVQAMRSQGMKNLQIANLLGVSEDAVVEAVKSGNA